MSNTPAQNPARGPAPGHQGNKLILVRKALGGADPIAFIRRLREQPKSFAFIAGELSQLIRKEFHDPELTISHETVRRWLDDKLPESERGRTPEHEQAVTLAEARRHLDEIEQRGSNRTQAPTAVQPQTDEHGVPQATFHAPPETEAIG